MNKVTINGKTVTIQNGKNVSVINNKIFVDGVEYKPEKGNSPSEKITIIIQGTVEKLEVQSDELTIEGDITGDVSTTGSLSCKNIKGDAKSGGSINSGNINGNVKAGGSVNCGNVGGECSAGGSINKG